MKAPTTIDIQLDKLLDESIRVHGYWIKNHVELIEEDLRQALKVYGYSETLQQLNDYKGQFCRRLYRKIKRLR